VAKVLFVRFQTKPGKEPEAEAFLRVGLLAVIEEHGTTPGCAIGFGHDDVVIFILCRAGRVAPLAGKVGLALIGKTPSPWCFATRLISPTGSSITIAGALCAKSDHWFSAINLLLLLAIVLIPSATSPPRHASLKRQYWLGEREDSAPA